MILAYIDIICYKIVVKSERPIREVAPPIEIPQEELKATTYYLAGVDQIGYNLGATGWPKDLRMRIAAYVKQPNEYLLQSLTTYLGSRIAEPSESELNAIASMSSSVADRIHPSITTGLIYGRALDEIKVKTIGRNTPTTSVNTLMVSSFVEAMWRTNGIAEADTVDSERLEAASSQQDNPGYHWYIPKIRQLSQAARIKRETEQQLPLIKASEFYYAEDLASTNDELVDQIAVLRKYGIKPCIAPSIGQSKTVEWLVEEPISEEFASSYAQYHPARKQLGTFYGSSEPIKSGERVAEEFTSYFPDGSKISLSMNTALGIDRQHATFRMGLDRDGHLCYPNSSQRWIDFLDPSLRLQYEQLRSEILSIYFDAVVPVHISEQAKEQSEQTPKRILGRIAIGQRKVPDLRKLILARQRIIIDKKNEIIAELENPRDDLVDRSPRKGIAKHEVVWHIRRLPPNYKASPKTRELCLRDTGIVLAEYGETYIHKHTRGSLENTSTGHKAAFKVGRVASKFGKR